MGSTAPSIAVPTGQLTNADALAMYNTPTVQQQQQTSNLNNSFTKEANKLSDNIKEIGQNPTKFVYTSLVVVPMLIVIILVLTSKLSVIYKIIDSILIIISLAFYYFQTKNVDIFTYFKSKSQ